jgi:ABC-2 type transport system ATP-binding protein
VSAAVEVQGLVRRFGALEAVRGISFAIERGQALGFIGPNGAGKTTTLRAMAALDFPTEGRVRICGHDTIDEPEAARRQVGWMPDTFGIYTHMSAAEYLDFFARAYGFRGDERRRRVAEVVEFTETGDMLDRELKALSKGMGQRLCLARALLHDPPVLLLDEPAAGLDPKARVEFKRLVRLLAAEGKTLFISSHILSELEEMCDALLFIVDGRVVHHGSAHELKTAHADAGAVVVVRVAGDPEAVRSFALAHPGAELVDPVPQGFRVRFESAEPDFLADMLKRMIHDGIRVVDFRREERRLEDAFIDALDSTEAP